MNHYTQQLLVGMRNWLKAYSGAPNSYSAFTSGYTFRTVFLSSALSYTGLTFCRVTFRSQDVTNGLTVAKAYIQTAGAGDAYDFSATPVQLTFNGGNANFSIGINATITSDPAVFTIPPSTNIVISGYTTAASGVGGKSGLGAGNRLYNKAGDDAATVNATGYSASTDGIVWPIDEISVS